MINKKTILIFSFLISISFILATANTTSYNIDSSHLGIAGDNATTSSYTFRSSNSYQQITSNFSTSSYTGDSGFLEIYTSCGDGTCNNGESCSSCSSDCEACAVDSVTTIITSGGVPTYTVSAEQFVKGYTKSVGRGWKLKFNVDSELHEIKVDKLTNSTIKIIVSSESQEATLAVGDTRRFELDNDSYYDLSVTLNEIQSSNRANLTIQSIHEEITLETIADEDKKEEIAENIFDDEDWKSEAKLIVVVLSILVGVWFIIKKKFREKRKKIYGY